MNSEYKYEVRAYRTQREVPSGSSFEYGCDTVKEAKAKAKFVLQDSRTLDKGNYCTRAIEFWLSRDGRRQSIVMIVTTRDQEQSISNYFLGGGHTWEELELALSDKYDFALFEKP